MVKLRKYFFGALLVILGVCTSLGQSDDLKILGESIAEALGYPAERLTISDVSKSQKAKTKGGVLAGIVVEGKDNTFATMAIGVSMRGYILTTELEAYCEKALSEQAEDREAQISKVTLASDAYGYTGLGVLGAGGSGERIIATWPSQGIDAQIAISISEDGLGVDDETEKYHRLIVEGGIPLADMLVQAMEVALDFAQRENLGVPVSGSAKSHEADASTRSQPPFVFPKRSLSPGVENSMSDDEVNGWRWVLALALVTLVVLGLVWLILRCRK